MIREIEQKDLQMVYELSKKEIKNSTLTLVELNSYLSYKHIRTFILEEENFIGYMILRLQFPELEIDEIAISGEKQNKGYGSSLLKYAFNLFKNEGYNRIYLEVRGKNLKACNFYLKNGFKKIGERKRYYNDDDAILFAKDLKDER